MTRKTPAFVEASRRLGPVILQESREIQVGLYVMLCLELNVLRFQIA